MNAKSTVLYLLLLAALSDASSAQTITRGPSIWENTSSSFLVAYKTSASIVGEVEWGMTQALGNTTTGPSTSTHAIRLTGLLPDCFYWYRIRLNATTVSGLYRARTSAAGGSDLSFFVFGDCGTGSSAQMRVRDIANTWRWDLGFLTGDIIYPDGQASGFDPYFFTPYADTLRKTPIYPTIGNHDAHTSSGQPYLDAFYLPTNGTAAERYYSFNFGDAHFIGLDSTTVSSTTQRNWLQNDLIAARAAGARWIFVAFHHAAYSCSTNHGSDMTVRNQWCPLFEQYEVDVVFQGHDHCYERTTVRRDFHPNNRGVVYFVVGTGGAGLYGQSPQSFTAYATSRNGLLKVDVRGDWLRTVFIDGSSATLGQFLDPYVISRGPVTPALRATSPDPLIGQAPFTGAFDAPSGWYYALCASMTSGYTTAPGLGIIHLGSIDSILMEGVMGAAQTAPFALPIPNVPALVGAHIYFQGVAVDLASTVHLTDLLNTRVR